jgi:hypothetical protein
MFSFLSALIGPTIASITGKLADARIAAAQASTDQERIHAEERALVHRGPISGRYLAGKNERLGWLIRGASLRHWSVEKIWLRETNSNPTFSW